VQWTAFPDRPIDYRKDIQMIEGRHWPLPISKAQFAAVTGEPDFPEVLKPSIHEGKLDYYCNNSVHYTLCGIHVKLEILWDWEAPQGAGDVYEATFRGTKSSVEIRQTKTENHIPELYIVPVRAVREDVLTALRKKLAGLQTQWPGLTFVEAREAVRIVVPETLRVGHEDHFGQVTNRFFDYLRLPGSMPAWERPNMLAKYLVSTKGVELS